MTKEQLLESAEKLVQPSQETAAEYAARRAAMVAEVNRIMLDRQDLSELIRDGNENMMQDNHNNHALFMASVFKHYHPEVLVETVIWVFRAYRSHGFNLTYWSAQLNAWIKVMEKELTPTAREEIMPFYNWLIVNIPVFSKLTDS